MHRQRHPRPPMDAAGLAAALGGALIVTSLFLEWFGGLSAWTVFELVDLLLALAGLTAFASLIFPSVPRALVSALGVGVLALVVLQLINHPPAAIGLEVETGAWLGLGGAALMAIAGVLITLGLSFSVSLQRAPDEPPRASERVEATPPPQAAVQPTTRPATSPKDTEPSSADPRNVT